MTHSFKLSRRIARLRAPLFTACFLTMFGCNDTDSFNPDSSVPPGTVEQGTDAAVLVDQPDLAKQSAGSSTGGIPFGMFKQPTAEFGAMYNGAMRNIDPKHLVSELAAIKARGGKVALMFVGPEGYYKDGAGHFSLTKWKARMDRFKNVNFDSYINDGTVIGHFMIDEPQDKANWNGVPVPQATLEAMAKYSKQRWPKLVTIARTWPDYLDDYKGKYQYLDAAWAQYVANRFPNPSAFIQENVSKAQAKGLALIVGLNTIKGSPTKRMMSASQVKEYGSALLSSSYPCAFISWQYRDEFNSSKSIKEAMSFLRKKANSRSFKTCRGG